MRVLRVDMTPDSVASPSLLKLSRAAAAHSPVNTSGLLRGVRLVAVRAGGEFGAEHRAESFTYR
jgi:hypothetical protein